MNRKKFLESIGISAASFAVINCAGCKKSTNDPAATTGPTSIDFIIDLAIPSNSSLLTNGGFIISNNVIVARKAEGVFLAVQRSCPHEGYSLMYQGPNNRFYCTSHGASFSENGNVTGGPTNRSLVTYRTELTGNKLRIYS